MHSIGWPISFQPSFTDLHQTDSHTSSPNLAMGQRTRSPCSLPYTNEASMAEGRGDSSGMWYPLLCILGFYGREGVICRVADSFLLHKCTTFSNLFLLNVKFLEAKCHASLLLCLMHDILWMVNKHHIVSTLNCSLESCLLSCFSKYRCFPRKGPFKSMPTNVSPFFPGPVDSLQPSLTLPPNPNCRVCMWASGSCSYNF